MSAWLAAKVFTGAGLGWMVGVTALVLGGEGSPLHGPAVVIAWLSAGAIFAAFAILLLSGDGVTYGFPRGALVLIMVGLALTPFFLVGLGPILAALVWMAVRYPAGTLGSWADERHVRGVAVALRSVLPGVVLLLLSFGGPEWWALVAALPFGAVFFNLGMRLRRLVEPRRTFFSSEVSG